MLIHETRKALYDLLEQVLRAQPVPPGAKGLLYRVVDQLRASPAPEDQLRTAEGISLQLHRLDAALLSKDAAAAGLIRNELKASAASWVQSCVCGSNSRR